MRSLSAIAILTALTACGPTPPRDLAVGPEARPPPRSLDERKKAISDEVRRLMARDTVHALSVAVYDYRVDWAKGYGVIEVGGAPATAETRFQAASIRRKLRLAGIVDRARPTFRDVSASLAGIEPGIDAATAISSEPGMF